MMNFIKFFTGTESSPEQQAQAAESDLDLEFAAELSSEIANFANDPSNEALAMQMAANNLPPAIKPKQLMVEGLLERAEFMDASRNYPDYKFVDFLENEAKIAECKGMTLKEAFGHKIKVTNNQYTTLLHNMVSPTGLLLFNQFPCLFMETTKEAWNQIIPILIDTEGNKVHYAPISKIFLISERDKKLGLPNLAKLYLDTFPHLLKAGDEKVLKTPFVTLKDPVLSAKQKTSCAFRDALVSQDVTPFIVDNDLHRWVKMLDEDFMDDDNVVHALFTDEFLINFVLLKYPEVLEKISGRCLHSRVVFLALLMNDDLLAILLNSPTLLKRVLPEAIAGLRYKEMSVAMGSRPLARQFMYAVFNDLNPAIKKCIQKNETYRDELKAYRKQQVEHEKELEKARRERERKLKEEKLAKVAQQVKAAAPKVPVEDKLIATTADTIQKKKKKKKKKKKPQKAPGVIEQAVEMRENLVLVTMTQTPIENKSPSVEVIGPAREIIENLALVTAAEALIEKKWPTVEDKCPSDNVEVIDPALESIENLTFVTLAEAFLENKSPVVEVDDRKPAVEIRENLAAVTTAQSPVVNAAPMVSDEKPKTPEPTSIEPQELKRESAFELLKMLIAKKEKNISDKVTERLIYFYHLETPLQKFDTSTDINQRLAASNGMYHWFSTRRHQRSRYNASAKPPVENVKSVRFDELYAELINRIINEYAGNVRQVIKELNDSKKRYHIETDLVKIYLAAIIKKICKQKIVYPTQVISECTQFSNALKLDKIAVYEIAMQALSSYKKVYLKKDIEQIIKNAEANKAISSGFLIAACAAMLHAKNSDMQIIKKLIIKLAEFKEIEFKEALILILKNFVNRQLDEDCLRLLANCEQNLSPLDGFKIIFLEITSSRTGNLARVLTLGKRAQEEFRILEKFLLLPVLNVLMNLSVPAEKGYDYLQALKEYAIKARDLNLLGRGKLFNTLTALVKKYVDLYDVSDDLLLQGFAMFYSQPNHKCDAYLPSETINFQKIYELKMFLSDFFYSKNILINFNCVKLKDLDLISSYLDFLQIMLIGIAQEMQGVQIVWRREEGAGNKKLMQYSKLRVTFFEQPAVEMVQSEPEASKGVRP